MARIGVLKDSIASGHHDQCMSCGFIHIILSVCQSHRRNVENNEIISVIVIVGRGHTLIITIRSKGRHGEMDWPAEYCHLSLDSGHEYSSSGDKVTSVMTLPMIVEILKRGREGQRRVTPRRENRIIKKNNSYKKKKSKLKNPHPEEDELVDHNLRRRAIRIITAGVTFPLGPDLHAAQ